MVDDLKNIAVPQVTSLGCRSDIFSKQVTVRKQLAILITVNQPLYVSVHSAGQVRRIRAGDDRSVRLLPQQEGWKLSGDKLAFSMAWRHKDHQAADLLVCQLVEIFAQ